MVVFPHAKINLGLYVLRLRNDGYRDISTVLVPIPLYDVLEVIMDRSLPHGDVIMTRSGIPVPGDPKSDLCLKAVELLRGVHRLPGLRIHLHKHIPIGAGLGGGSSDGAHTLLALNDLLDLRLERSALHRLATALGSDCPFFLERQAQLGTGRGEVLAPIAPRMQGWWLLLMDPGVHVSTAEVYAHTAPAPGPSDLREVLTCTDPSGWNGHVHNVMEEYVLSAYPQVAAAKRSIAALGASYVSMSGSGASVFGLFAERPTLPALPEGQRSWLMRL